MSGVVLFGNMKKTHRVALIAIVVALIVFATFFLFVHFGPSSDKSMVYSAVEYILDEYGAVSSKGKTWSDYSKRESDLPFPNYTAIGLCNYLGLGEFAEEALARKALLEGCTYTISGCEFIKDSAIVTVDLDTPRNGKAVAKIRFEKKGGSWEVDHESVFLAVLAGNGIGGSGNAISDIFKSLRD